MLEPAIAPTGCVVNLSWDGAPGVIKKELLVALIKALPLAASVVG
jgi:hypothetical protein